MSDAERLGAGEAVVPGTEDGDGADGPSITVANEFSEVVVRLVHSRNGARLLIDAPRAGRSIALCPLELEALTWQTPATFSAMMENPYRPLDLDDR